MVDVYDRDDEWNRFKKAFTNFIFCFKQLIIYLFNKFVSFLKSLIG